ncbi:phage shock protein E [Pseudoalteromonas sp. A25]|uniref:rhodanese-like domain-containing protein n=1 Tax=Pseudoalteromonas sp. A25 TaxID=116092 RepID=UPI001260EB44|nr:rhodanese-like domain-containing protein [Pseudoalteromonas sp. A25]BBN81522.1 phage shock protein E [Pseudoalteromonas sp. A25]
MWLRYLVVVFLCISTKGFTAQSITAQDLLINQMSDNAYVIIDVRTKEEFNAGHLKGAINIPHDEIDQHKEVLSNFKSQEVVVYCRSGRRAGLFIDKLTSQGYKLIHLQGDMNGWQGANLPTVVK